MARDAGPGGRRHGRYFPLLAADDAFAGRADRPAFAQEQPNSAAAAQASAPANEPEADAGDEIIVTGTIGVRGEVSGWNGDLSVGYGHNQFDYTIRDSLNTSFGTASQSVFDAGGLDFGQPQVNVAALPLPPPAAFQRARPLELRPLRPSAGLRGLFAYRRYARALC